MDIEELKLRRIILETIADVIAYTYDDTTENIRQRIVEINKLIGDNLERDLVSDDETTIKNIVEKYGDFTHPYIKGKNLAFYLLNHTDYGEYMHNKNYYTKFRREE